MNVNYDTVLLAALFHDVGKIGQRAFKSSEGLSPSSANLEQNLCPKSKEGYYTHKHVLYTNEFCEQITTNLPDGINPSELANLASYHHNPADDLHKLITDADHLSSAMERETIETSGMRDRFRKVLLNPVVSQVSTCTSDNYSSDIYRFTLEKFSPDFLFPFEQESEIDQTERYKVLWKSLLKIFNNISIRNPKQYANAALSILEKIAWSVPSATNVETPDISLFDHLKTTSAIAGCLHLSELDDEPFILAAGDFGGIQNYIFNLTGSKGRAKALRGRSFQVGAFSDNMAIGLIHELGLILSHLIISAGGRFYLLLPNSKKTVEVLTQKRKELHEWILREKNGELRVNLVWESFARESVLDFPSVLSDINSELDDVSYRGFVHLSSANGWHEEQWTRTGFVGRAEELCRSCQKNRVEDFARLPHEQPICDTCRSEQSLGGEIVKNALMEIAFDKSLLKYPLVDSSFEFIDKINEMHPVSDLVIGFRGELMEELSHPLFTILRNNYVPRDDKGNVLELTSIADMSKGRKLLGILKADIDNLGFIFSRGLIASGGDGKDRKSISRLTSLSRSLENFFSGYIYHLLESEYPMIYTVFSGGDDLMLIGPWDNIHDFALELYAKFQRYTCFNPSWGLSAGIGIIKPKTPVSLGNTLASENLKRSKNMDGKNSITTMGTTMSWREYKDALSEARKLSAWIEDGVLNTSKIQRFMQYGIRLLEFYRTKDTSKLDVIPKMIYDLTRNWTGTSNDQKTAKEWAYQYTNPEFRGISLLAFICQYALYLNREVGNE